MANIHLKDWFAALPDPHFPCQSVSALKVATEVVKDVKPTWNICLGDIADLDALSTYARYQSEVDVLDEYNAIEEWLTLLEKQKTPLTHLLEGNHEERVRRSSNTRWELRRILSPEHNLKLKQRKIKWVPYSNDPKKVLCIRGVTFLHGFSFGKYAAFDHATDWGNCVHGHTHRFQIGTAIDQGDVVYGISAGWLGDEQKIKHHRSGRPRGWQNALIVGRIPKSGRWSFYPVLIEDGKANFLRKEYLH